MTIITKAYDAHNINDAEWRDDFHCNLGSAAAQTA